jgi:TRAP-type C4-dicarboxylate transport system substrate-binding protein
MQKLMSDAAVVAANIERKESVDDVKVIQDKCKQDGISVVTLNADEQAKFKTATEGVYTKYENFFTTGLIQKIKQTH